MNHQIVVAGKPALKYAKDGIAEYMKRLTRYGNFSIKQVKDGSSEDVSKRLYEASEKSIRIVMDERGELLNTDKLYQKMQNWQMNGTKNVSYLIGASDGHTQELRDSGDLVLALSPLTLQHELALLVLVEQLYRIETIRSGLPYHR
ncbi:23S rRNA (pseudouridine(1915)-N(3))-methyltransferase RlmH [Akkermansiaceae bacterium]|nr:23S rRNA (pseudouridine(1915)-N(3))-methyltransferase RlmH [Akkermansiaceae bacterium]